MKKFNRILLVLLILTFSVVGLREVDASSATTYTRAFDRKG
jgi:hypothetical protein